MANTIFTWPDLTTFCALNDLGLVVAGPRLEPDRAVLACRVSDSNQWCRDFGCHGVPRGAVMRTLDGGQRHCSAPCVATGVLAVARSGAKP